MRSMQGFIKRTITALMAVALITTSMPLSVYAGETSGDIADAAIEAMADSSEDITVPEEAGKEATEASEPVSDEAAFEETDVPDAEEEAASEELTVEDETDTKEDASEEGLSEEEQTEEAAEESSEASTEDSALAEDEERSALMTEANNFEIYFVFNSVESVVRPFFRRDDTQTLDADNPYYGTTITAIYFESFTPAPGYSNEFLQAEVNGIITECWKTWEDDFGTSGKSIWHTNAFEDEDGIPGNAHMGDDPNYVEIICKPLPGVGVTLTTDGSNYSDQSSATVDISGVVRDSDGKPVAGENGTMIPKNTQIDVAATPKEGYEIAEVTYTVGDGDTVECASDDDNPWYVPETVVRAAAASQKAININVETKKIGLEVKFTSENDRVAFYAYEKAVLDSDGVIQSGDQCGKRLTGSATAEYDTEFCFVATPLDADAYEVASVSVNGKELEPQVDHYYENEKAFNEKEETTSSLYYVIKTKEAVTVSATVEVFPALNGSSFVVDDQASHAAFEIDKKYATVGKDKKTYTFVKDTKDFIFKVTTDYKYDPVVELGYPDPGTGEFVNLKYLYPADAKNNANKTKRTYTFLSAPGELDGRILRISDRAATRQIFVGTKADFTLSANGAAVKMSSSPYGPFTELPIGSKITIEFKEKPGTQIVVEDITDEDNPKPLTANKGVLSFTLENNIRLTASLQDIPVMYLELISGHPVMEVPSYADNATVNIGSEDRYILQVNYGEYNWSEKAAITGVTARMGKKDVDGFAVLGKNDGKPDGTVVIDAEAANKSGTSPIAVTITGEFGTKTLNFVVAQRVTSISLKGFKNKEVNQPAGTTVSYQVTLNSGADYYSLQADGADGTDYKNFEVDYSPEDKKLTVRTFKEGVLAENDIRVAFLRGKEGAIEEFKVHLTEAKLPAPTVKFKNSNDIAVELSLGLPKAVKDYQNLYYKVEAKAVGTVDTGRMFKETTQYFSVENSTCSVYLSPNGLGYGMAQKYNINVSLVQVKNNTYEPFGDKLFAAENIGVTGAVKTLKNLSTKNPAYETKLALTKKAASITYGDEDVLIAQAKFSAKTTWRIIDYVSITDSYGRVFADSDGQIRIDNYTGKVYLYNYPEEMVPGQYTLNVYPIPPTAEGAYAYVTPATLKLTVKPSVTTILLTPYGDHRIYKAPKKAAAFTLKANFRSEIADQTYKPANTKVRWIADAENPELLKRVSVKNGKVTVSKDFVPGPDPADNTFGVRAIALDRENNPCFSDWAVFEITTASFEPAKIQIGEVVGGTGTTASGISTKFDEQYLAVLDSAGEVLPINEFNISVSPKNGLTVDPENGFVRVTRLGTYTIKATALDGSRKSVSAKFSVVSDRLVDDPNVEPYSMNWSCMQMLGMESGYVSLNADLSDDKEATVYGAYFIRFTVKPMTETEYALYSGAVTVTAKGAKKLNIPDGSDPNEQVFYFRPTKSDMEFTVSSKDGLLKKTTYKIHNNIGSGTLKANKKEYSFYTNDTLNMKELGFDVSGLNIDPEAENTVYALIFDPEDKYLTNLAQGKDAIELCNQLSDESNGVASTDLFFDENDGTKVVKVSKVINPDRLVRGKGTYNCYATLWKAELKDGDKKPTFTPLTSPVKITVKFSDAPKPVITLNKKISMSGDHGSRAMLVKSMKDGLKEELRLLNDNDGQMVNTCKYLFITKDKETGAWMIARTEEALPEGMKSITGWIQYGIYALDGSHVTRFEKITVNFK